MSNRAIRIAAALLLSLAAPALHAQGVMPAPGDTLPELRGFGSDGLLYIVEFDQAKFTLINFWASWCEPCKNEMPMLEKAHKELGPQGLNIVGVTSEALSDEDMRQFATDMSVTYPLVRIGDESKRVWPGIRGTLPNSFLVDQQGRMVRRYVGASPEQILALEADLAAVIAGRPLGPMVMPSSSDDVVKGGTDKAPKR